MNKLSLGPVEINDRGFEFIEFRDKYGEICSLQQSSLAENDKPGTSAVWLGYERKRMHLDRNQVASLIAHLFQWLDAGTFFLPDTK
jgi:hypothetical protein